VGARILITGCCGLIGTDLGAALEQRGYTVVGLDLARGRDVRDPLDVGGFDGVVHLAAVSRVAEAEADPDRCWSVNVGGTENLMAAVAAARRRPWVLFASSREVYGQPSELPVDEEAPLQPLNIYGRAKVRGEVLVAQGPGLHGIVRLSNVYGRTHDHADRVVPAFARAAALGGSVRVDGLENGFDFTHIDDVTRGLVGLVEQLGAGTRLPPIHLVSGRETSLGRLASLAMAHGASGFEEAAPRSYDVSRFVGRGDRARRYLDWEPMVSLEHGFQALVDDFRCRLSGDVAEPRRGAAGGSEVGRGAV